jgi:Photosynthesis system II assembly factor YCF48
MPNVPKIVHARLQRPTPLTAESHPDADLLTAFAEQSLIGPERDQVVEHLSHCGDCREVVSLALPPQLEAQPVAHGGASWFQWPVMRWAVVAAGVALIASIGTLQHRSRRPRELALNVPQAKESIASPAPIPQPASQAAVPEAGMQKDKLAAPRARAAVAENKSVQSDSTDLRGHAVLGGAIAGPVVRSGVPSGAGRNSFHGSVAASAAALPNSAPATAAKHNPAPAPTQQPVAVSGASQVVEVQSQTAQVTPQPTTPSRIQDQVIQSDAADQSQAYADRVGKAKAASAQTSTVMAPAPALHRDPSLMQGPTAPRWTISASGALQRSLDGGKTWLDVNVAVADSILDSRAKTQMMTIEVTAEAPADLTNEAPPAARSSVNAKSAKKQSAPAAPTTFRALSVSSNATEVWAGGSGGALYHTVDAGNNWSRVVPSAAGITLAGDVTSIQFSDPQNGTVTTSTPEVWTTRDAGQTWQKRP